MHDCGEVHDETEAQGLGGIQLIAREAVAVGGLPAGQRGEQDRRVGGVADLGLGEDGVVGGIVMSAASEYQKPPPITQPWTAAMTGVVTCQRWMSRAEAASRVHQSRMKSA